MRFPDDAPVTKATQDALRRRLLAVGLDLARVEMQAIRAGGPGGQKVNKTSSGVRLAYPLGDERIQVKWTRERSHALNRFLALRELADAVEARVSPSANARRTDAEHERRRKSRARRRTAARSEAPPPPAPFEVVTFDVYGTLIDWESGIARGFAALARATGQRPPSRAAVLAAYADAEPAEQAGPHRPYRDVLASAARVVAARVGLRIPPGREGFLADGLPGWTPFDDVNPGLARLARAGVRLGLLSNVDDDLLAGTRRHLDVAFDLLVTAEQVRAYKPAPDHFREAARRLGPASARWLHAAQSLFHDVATCGREGIPVAWIDRRGERDPRGTTPRWRCEDLGGLVRALEGP